MFNPFYNQDAIDYKVINTLFINKTKSRKLCYIDTKKLIMRVWGYYYTILLKQFFHSWQYNTLGYGILVNGIWITEEVVGITNAVLKYEILRYLEGEIISCVELHFRLGIESSLRFKDYKLDFPRHNVFNPTDIIHLLNINELNDIPEGYH